MTVQPAMSERARAEIASRLRQRTALVFDYDGTLTPLVDHPDRAFLPPAMHTYLVALTRVAPCALLTGRSLAQMRTFVPDVPFVERIGNHGAEWSSHATDAHRVSDALREEVFAAAAAVPQAIVEDKVYGLSVHTRLVESQAESEILSARLAALPGVRIIPGKRVINVLPKDAPDKGEAMLLLHERLDRPHVMFFGDDVTDELVFALEKPWLTGVRIGRSAASKAAYYLESQAEMDAFLGFVVSLFPTPR